MKGLVGASAGAINAGIGAGAGAGIGAGAASKLFSKERKAWRALVKQEKEARKKGANATTLKKIEAAKAKARENYKNIKRKAMKKGAKRGAITGAIGGAITASTFNGAALGGIAATA